MFRQSLLASGSVAALAIAAAFFDASPAMAACAPSAGTLPSTFNSGITIDCTGTVSQATSIADNAAADNVSVILENNASVSVSDSGAIPAPTAFAVGNNASFTVNSGASLVTSGKFGVKGTAFSGGTNLTALIMSGGSVTGTITGGAGSHVTIAGTSIGGVLLTGDNNIVTLDPGSSVSSGLGGNIATGGDSGAINTTLELGGSGTASFDGTAIGITYTNFAKFLKSGDSAWTLIGTHVQASSPWTITGGTLLISDDASLGDATSTLTLNGGLLDLTATTAGSRPIVLGGGGFTVDSGVTYTYSGAFSGTGALSVAGAGTLALSGAETVAGLTGSGNLALAARLTSSQSADTIFSGVISGAGSLAKSGSGKLTLTGVNTYTGGTTLSAGTLAGTGKIGALTVTGGTLAPGVGLTSGTFSTGALTLGTGATTLINVAPASNSSVAVTGAASLGGALTANITAGTYAVGSRYTVLTATGGVSGSFASVTAVGLSAALKPVLSYDANDAYLTLAANALTPLLTAGATPNELAIAGAIDTAVHNGATLSTAFSAIFNASGTQLAAALDQLSGEIGGDAAQIAGQSLLPFLNMMTGSGTSNSDVNTASNAPAGVRPAQAADGEMRFWGGAFGGAAAFDPQAASGAQGLSTNLDGAAIGVEQNFGDLQAGASLGLGSSRFALYSRQSSGTSTDILLGAYLRAPVLESGYISGAIGYGWHNIKTERAVTIGATSVLDGKFSGNDIGGRVEAGYRVSLDDAWAWTPYAALAGNSFSAPAYAETAVSGAGTFALAYAAETNSLLHSELGGRLNQDWQLSGDKLSLELKAAWAHQLINDNATSASFQNLVGSGFAVIGVKLPRDSADLSAGLQVGGDSGFSGGARIEGQFADGFIAGSGMINFGYRW